MESNNPANQISQAAKSRGLSYWEYIESTQPHHVQKFAWGDKKETRKEKRAEENRIIPFLGGSIYPMARLFSKMRSSIGKRSAY